MNPVYLANLAIAASFLHSLLPEELQMTPAYSRLSTLPVLLLLVMTFIVACDEGAQDQSQKPEQSGAAEEPTQWTVRTEGPIALLDGDPVDPKQFNEMVASINEPRTQISEEALHQFIEETLDMAVESALLERAAQQSDIEVDEADLERQVERQVEELRALAPDGESIEDMLPETDDGLEDLRARIRREIILEELASPFASVRPELGVRSGESYVEHLLESTEVTILDDNLVIEAR